MNIEEFIENITEQIKEAQLKLGFAREIIRLYFPAESLCRLLQLEDIGGRELLSMLEQENYFADTVLGTLKFSLCKDDRIEVCIPSEGAEYVYRNVPNPPFLSCIIELFRKNHQLSIEEICGCFEQFNSSYICEKMKPGSDFDYVLHFPDHKPDAWYYCVRMEMEHTIYHRFTEEDYHSLIS